MGQQLSPPTKSRQIDGESGGSESASKWDIPIVFLGGASPPTNQRPGFCRRVVDYAIATRGNDMSPEEKGVLLSILSEEDRANRSNMDIVKQAAINEIRGDLFACASTDALVHCVSRDLKMGKGIATQFKKRFGMVDELKSQDKQVGEVASLRHVNATRASSASEDADGKGRMVYYMITKEKYHHKPKLDDFKSSLTQLREAAIEDQVAAISMPRIGCGLDGLVWNVVKPLICEAFAGTGIVINVYIW